MQERRVTRVFVSHPSDKLDAYFGAEASAALAAFAEVRYNREPRALSTPELADAARDCSAVIAYRQTPAPEALFAALPELVVFARCAMDIRSIDVAAASRHGVLVTQASAGFVAAVSEWVVAVMIDLGRGIGQASAAYHDGAAAAPTIGRELRGATLGVIGYGRIGRAVCDLGKAFGMRVVVSDPHVAAVAGMPSNVQLPALLSASDFVVCLAPASAETESLMDVAAFAAMKPGSFFVNASRGDLVDDSALLRALESGHLAGCAVDVGRAADQMPSPEVARHPRVIATPHIGGLTRAATSHQALETVAQIEALLQGRLPPGAVNATHASRLRRWGHDVADSAT